MLRLGLTGGIGAGKSTVTSLFAEAGAYIVDADLIARQVVKPGTPGLAMLVAEFGEDILTREGELNRQALAQQAFSDPVRTSALNAITHPLIAERTAELVAAAPVEALVVHDMPLLVESGLAPTYHLVMLVDTPSHIRLERVVEQRGLDAEDARARMGRQATDSERRAVADIVVDNSGPREQTAICVEDAIRNRLLPFEHNLRTKKPVLGSPEVVAHRPEWAAEASRAVARLWAAIGESARSIAHVGPTADPRRESCDVIHLEIVVDGPGSGPAAAAVAGRLTEAGYLSSRAGFPVGENPVFRWCDPARPLLITIRGEDALRYQLAGIAEGSATVITDPPLMAIGETSAL